MRHRRPAYPRPERPSPHGTPRPLPHPELPCAAGYSNSATPVEIQEPCDFSSTEFSFISNPPRGIEDCIQVEVNYIDGYIRHTFVLDGDGRVWQWRQARSGIKASVEQVCFPGLGLFIGVCLGIPVALLSRRKKVDGPTYPLQG